MTHERTQTGVHDGAQDGGHRSKQGGGERGGPGAHSASSAGPNATPDRYDFERLERSIDFLIDEHQRLSAEREALLEELVDREQRLSALESELESERQRRLTAVEGVDKILGRLAQLQTSVSAAVESA